MTHYDFDTPIDRHGTDCFKWDALPGMYGRDDLTPMWVADMDFPSPDFVSEAIRQRCRHEVYGYTMPSEGYWQAVTTWLDKHYVIHTTKESLHFIPGIVTGISYVLLCLTKPGDRVLVTPPVYPPFINAPKGRGLELVYSPLKTVPIQAADHPSAQSQPSATAECRRFRFEIDFDDFEQKVKDCKVFIMSNPHNPAGTRWGTTVLQRVAEICNRHNVLVVSDEIHADLTLPGHRHVSYSTVSAEAAAHSITFMAPSKTFNIPGLGSSVCHIANPELRKRFYNNLDSMGLAGGNIFAYTATEAVFRLGEEWRLQLLDYLALNVQATDQFLREELPLVKAVLPEASYLAWLDFSAYGIPHKQLLHRFIHEARVVMNDGTDFGGEAFEGCFRLNLGCPRTQLLDCLNRIAKTIKHII